MKILTFIIIASFLVTVSAFCIEIPDPPFKTTIDYVLRVDVIKLTPAPHPNSDLVLRERITTWIMKIEDNRFYFNTEEFPQLSADRFADKVIKILGDESGMFCIRKDLKGF